MRKILHVLPRCTIILSTLFLIFLVPDHFNPLARFADNDISPKLLLGFCFLSLICCMRFCAIQRAQLPPSIKEADKSAFDTPCFF